MKIVYANIEFPSRSYGNDDILDLVRSHSLNSYEGDTLQLVKKVDLLLELSGAKMRRWISSDEEARELVSRALEKARDLLRDRELWTKPGLIISASVDRVFSEPGDSYFYAHQLGLAQVHCIDILDACNSHVRAWHLAQALLKLKTYQWVLVISAEMKSGFQLLKGKFKERFSFVKKQELSWKFPALTLGDAIATSILVADEDGEDQDWLFEIESNAANAPLCFAQSEGGRQFEHLLQAGGPDSLHKKGFGGLQNEGQLQFVCNYSHLESESLNSVVQVWKALRKRVAAEVPLNTEWLITHCSNSNGWAGAARWAGFSLSKHMNLYSEYGNVISCSVPGALALLQQGHRLQPNNKINVWTGAAGSSYFAFQFTFDNGRK